ncbi:MAG: alpha/beta hydrolase [Oricola sp.]
MLHALSAWQEAGNRTAGILLAACLAGCAGLPEGVLTPLETRVAGATDLPILVATTREPSSDPAVLFTGERGPDIDLTEIVVSIPPEDNRTPGEVQWPRKLPPDPAKDFATLSVSAVPDVAAAERWFRRNRRDSRRMLIFVHGFNNRYEDAVYRFAQIVHDSHMDATPVLFTWPSRGSIFAYGYDKESTNYSRSALETVLAAAAKNPDVGEITVLAHSMGTWLTVESLRQMAIRNGGIPGKIENVILAAPDLDVDVFRQQLADMGPKRPAFTVFVSRDDRALQVSRRISGNVDRLGAIDINDPRYVALLEREGITVLDLTALRAGDRLNHSKFAQSPEAVRILGERLVAGQTVTDQNIGLGEQLGAAAIGVTNTVGSAASLAVSVPIAIVDPKTRESLDEQAGRFGRNLGSAMTGMVPVATTSKRRCGPGRGECESPR